MQFSYFPFLHKNSKLHHHQPPPRQPENKLAVMGMSPEGKAADYLTLFDKAKPMQIFPVKIIYVLIIISFLFPKKKPQYLKKNGINHTFQDYRGR